MAARRNSLPELWEMPAEHGQGFKIDKRNLKMEELEINIKIISRQFENFSEFLMRQRERDDNGSIRRELTSPIFSGNLNEDAEEFLQD